jgi:putative membrane protein
MIRLESMLIATLVWITIPATVIAQTVPDRPVYWHCGMQWGWGHMVFGSLMMLLLLGAIVALIILAARWLGGSTSGGAGSMPAPRTSLDILKERFARGEIDKQEFEERRRLLSE